MKHRRPAVGIILLALGISACSNTSTSTKVSSKLAADQVLRFPIASDISTLDPGLVTSTQDDQIVQNVFAGLYSFNNQLVEVPDMATALPDVSTDGLTYTFHLRHNMKFSNGDPVTSADVLYSWNRTARLNGEDGFIFKPVVGYAAVAPVSGTPTATTLSGLTAPDPYTVVATLSSAASYWIDELAIPAADIVDQKEIPNDLNRTWSENPSTAIGTGPFKLTAYVPNNHLSFTNVKNWWGGSTGTLTDVEIDVITSSASQVTEYLNGGLDEIGAANTPPALDAVEHFESDSSLKGQVSIGPGGATYWVGIDMANGPFAPSSAAGITDPVSLAGRLAFSMSINRTELANVACGSGELTCTPATGGVIPAGLRSNLGVNGDPSAIFNPTKAKQELQTWDPSGTKRQGLTYWYYTQDLTATVAANLQSQWQENLGIHVNIEGVDFTSYLATLQKKNKYLLFADYTSAFYNNPEDWFARQFVCSQAAPGLDNLDGICDPRIDSLVSQAESETEAASIATYTQANQLLAGDGAFAVLFYAKNVYFIKPYVAGAGGNPLDDYYWTGISILAH